MVDNILVTAAGLGLVGGIVWLFWGPRKQGYRAALASSGYQEATVLVKGGYTPDTIVVRAGKPVRLTFRRKEASPCSECESLADLQPQGLAITYWLDPAPTGAPYPVSIRFTGQRVGATRKRGSLDRFSVVESLQVVPGSGPVAITARVDEITPGDWQVTARPVSPGQRNGAARSVRMWKRALHDLSSRRAASVSQRRQ